jgi:hypothetical protein
LGYSARYHAASLAAVFLALAVGILIGAGLGENLVSDTEDNLRESLENDIEDARGEADGLQADLDRERAFSSTAFPALVGDTLEGRRIGVVAFGDLAADVSGDIERALEPTGAELTEVVVVRRPPDPGALAAQLGPKFSTLDEDEAQLEDLGRRLGRQLVAGSGQQLDKLRNLLFGRSSGEGGRLDGVILVRPSTGEIDGDAKSQTDAIESGLIEGIADTGTTAVAVERSGVEESSIPFFGGFDVASVDSVDLTAGRVGLVFTLLGAEGNFGVKGTANSLLPELLEPEQQPTP